MPSLLDVSSRPPSRISSRRSTVVRMRLVEVKAGVDVPGQIGCRLLAQQLGGPAFRLAERRSPRRHVEAFQDPSRHSGVSDCRRDPHPTAACGTMQRIDLEDPLQEIRPGCATGRGHGGSNERREASSCGRRNGAAADRSRPKNCGSRQRNDVGAACWTSTEAVARPADPRLRV